MKGYLILVAGVLAGVFMGIGAGYAALKLCMIRLEKVAEGSREPDARESDEDLMVQLSEMPPLTPFLR